MPTWLPLLLGFLTALGPLSIDMYLPAFPAIEAGFGVAKGSAEITLAAWFAGLAVGQLAQGTLADRLGRRRPLLVGLVIYAVGSVGCAMAPSIEVLSLFRCIAAFGGSASMVLPRAVVRDIAEGHEAARIMSRLMLVMGAAPILAPSLGGLMLRLGDWRMIFWFSFAYSLVSLLLVWRLLPETLPPERRLHLKPAAQLLRYAQILRDRSFVSHTAMGCAALFMMFTYVGASPSVFVGLFGLDPTTFAILFGVNASCFIACSQFNPALLMRLGAGRLVRLAVRTLLAATLVLAALAFSGTLQLATAILPCMVIMGASAFVLPNSAVGALSRQGGNAGSASALMGTLQFGVAGCSGVLLSWLADGTARPMAALMVAGALAAVLAERARPVR
jgi:DHA1 family bicyclomycin/chloramphenicol resistance-like MFS transporter